MTNKSFRLRVSNETGTLRRVLIHSPDSGLGKVVPSKAQDWLFEDIVHLETIRKEEYDYYIKLLLYFLDEEKIKGKLSELDHPEQNRSFYKPGHPNYFASDKVVELQVLLMDILCEEALKSQLVASVCAMEACTYEVQTELLQHSPEELSKLFFSGMLMKDGVEKMIFPPIPNFIFTRDIGITINDHILLNKPKKEARKREALLAKYVFFHHPYFKEYRKNIIELTDSDHHFLLPLEQGEPAVTLEGGDVMVVAPNHVLIGVSERTSKEAATQAAQRLFEKKVVDKVTIVQIPYKRDYMHIDTVFTQVKRNVWVLLGEFANRATHTELNNPIYDAIHEPTQPSVHIWQFKSGEPSKPIRFSTIEDLLRDISISDLQVKKSDVQIILSGDGQFPYDAREQWTDSCNVLALKDGVVVAYDRNDFTNIAFEKAGFKLIEVKKLIEELELGTTSVGEIENTVILMPSAELSRARGGFHCMSMPLERDQLK
jgi:arginine deiminase